MTPDGQDQLVLDRYRDLQNYVGWTAEDASRVASIANMVQPHFRDLVDDFYSEIDRHEGTKKVITGGTGQVERLKGSLIRWLHELFSGVYDAAYVMRRWRVGLRHVEIGLDQIYTNAALSRLRSGLLRVLERDWSGDPQVFLLIRRSLNALLDLDLALIEDAYQTEFQQRQQRIERLVTIGHIAGGVAHELRNPLNVVKTSVYYLRTARNPPQEKVTAHLERIERQVAMADGVITALNNFARLPVPALQPIEPVALLRKVLEFHPLPANIEVVVREPNEPLLAHGDPDQLGIVLGNLVRNARDAMPDGGTLTLQVDASNRFVEITVSDTGTGIPPDSLGRITEPLFSTKSRGIGLGLSITKAILDRHGGRLLIKSEVGRGSQMTIQLPSPPIED